MNNADIEAALRVQCEINEQREINSDIHYRAIKELQKEFESLKMDLCRAEARIKTLETKEEGQDV